MNYKQIAQWLLYAKGAYETVNTVTEMLEKYKAWSESNRRYRLELQANTAVFEVAQEWISSQLDLDKMRDISVGSRRTKNETVLMYSVGSGIGHVMLHDTYKVYVSMDDDEKMAGDKSPQISHSSIRPPGMTLSVETKAARKALINYLRHLVDERTRESAGLYLPGMWGDWTRTRDIPRRPICTVAYDAGQGERLLADLRKFISEESRYDSYGLPWHRGYMLHGKPGTGKTSTAMALAYETGRDLYYLPLADFDSDTKLTEVIANVPQGSILLLEDVDVFSALIERQETEKSVTMAGVLNVLDGALTPHGLVTIMTTNHFDKLDPAIIRPGRVDVVEEFQATEEHVRILFERFYGMPYDGPIKADITPAAATQLFMHSPVEVAIAAMEDQHDPVHQYRCNT